MPTAAGIIVATGAMTILNDLMQPGTAPLTTVMDKLNWRVIPATAVAAAIFYGFEQLNAPVAKALAASAFITAFFVPIFSGPPVPGGYGYSPFGTLLNLFKIPTTGATALKGYGSV